MTVKDRCQKQACAIQDCLKKNNYNEAYCFDAIEYMRKCCAAWKHESLCCQGFLKDISSKDRVPLQGANLISAATTLTKLS
jgi:mature T-cell proliferation 1 neighbor protein